MNLISGSVKSDYKKSIKQEGFSSSFLQGNTAESIRTFKRLPSSVGFPDYSHASAERSIKRMKIIHETDYFQPEVKKTLHQLIIYRKPLTSSLTKEQWIEVVCFCGIIIPDKHIKETNHKVTDQMPPDQRAVVLQLIKTAPDQSRYGEITDRWPGFISHIPNKSITPTMWITAIKRDNNIILTIPPDEQTLEMWTLAIKTDPSLIKKQPPEKFQNNWSLWQIACSAHPSLIKSLPEELKERNLEKNQQLCINIFLQDTRYGSLLDEKTKTNKLWKLACSNTAKNIRFFDSERISSNTGFYQELCQIVCNIADDNTLHHIKLEFFDEATKIDLCKRAIVKNSLNYKYLPNEYRTTREFAMLACYNDVSALIYEKHLDNALKHDWEVCKTVIFNVPIRIDEIPHEVLVKNSKDLCSLFEQIVKRNYSDIEYFPSFLIVDNEDIYHELIKTACNINGKAFRKIPEAYQTEELFITAFNSSPSKVLQIPERLKKRTNYTEFCKRSYAENCWFQNEVNSGERTLESYIETCREKPRSINCVPDGFVEEVLKQCPESKYYLKPDSCCFPLESAKRMSLLGSYLRNKLLFDSGLDNETKIALIDFIHHPELPDFTKINPEELYKPVNPLSVEASSPYLEQLLYACYKNDSFKPPDLDIGKQLIEAINQATPTFHPCQNEEALLREPWEICGGRTVQTASGSQDNGILQYYKFQRKDEPLDVLTREGLTHEFFEKMNTDSPASPKPFKSRWPKKHRFISLPLNQLPQGLINQFDDEVEITINQKGEQFVNIYCFEAKREYYIYAHTPDASNNPFYRAEQGLLMASHDVGRGARMGILFTNTLPAFHDTSSGRRWVMLHHLMGCRSRNMYSTNLELPGTFGGWNSAATERPDFGHDGLRDIGDFEFFGEVKDLFKIKDLSPYTHPPGVMQKIAMANTLCENILAACLLYARLHQNCSDYHYCNQKAVTATGQFIEKAINEMLVGLLPAERNRNLQEMMDINNEEYKKWLNRATLEIIYFTSKQVTNEDFISISHNTNERKPEILITNPVNCFTRHITENWKFCESLYPDQSNKLVKFYPSSFINPAGKENLGLHNRIFPPTTLVKGLFCICIGYFLITDTYNA